jgi:hypothetical protein
MPFIAEQFPELVFWQQRGNQMKMSNEVKAMLEKMPLCH